MTYFGEQNQGDYNNKIVTEKTPIIELNAVHPLSQLRDDIQESGGTVTDGSSEYILSHSNGGDFARLTSSSRGRYLPGNTSEIGIGFRLDQPTLSGDVTAYMGYFEMGTESDGRTNAQDIKNGLLFGQDSNGKFIEIINSGSSTFKTYKGSWNMNNDVDTDFTKGDIYQIMFNYYGYGLVTFQKVDSESGDNGQNVIPLHSFKPQHQTSLSNSNLQVGGLIKSDTTDQDVNLYIAGRKYSIIGRYTPQTRINTQSFENVTIDTSDTFIASFRKKTNKRQISIELFGLEGISDNDILIETRLNMDTTGATYNNLDNQLDVETSLEYTTSVTDFDRTTGVKLFETMIPSSGGGNSGSNLSTKLDLPVDIGDEGIISVIGRALNSQASSTIIMNLKEEF